jgi:hypothetical protein
MGAALVSCDYRVWGGGRPWVVQRGYSVLIVVYGRAQALQPRCMEARGGGGACGWWLAGGAGAGTRVPRCTPMRACAVHC